MATVHVYPGNDLVDHETDGKDCPCGPTTEAVPGENGYIGWLVVHESLDRREDRE